MDQLRRPEAPGRRDPAIRTAALWATAIAVPIAVLVGWLLLASAGGGTAASAPSPAPPRARSTAPVPLAAPTLSGQPAGACRTLVASLPDRIRDLDRRPVTAGAEQNAAYGEPALTLSCGTAAPTFPLTDVVVEMDGVCWHQAGGAQSNQWTAIDRQVPVQVVVPGGYQGAAQWVNEFSRAVAAAVPAASTAPAGCASPG